MSVLTKTTTQQVSKDTVCRSHVTIRSLSPLTPPALASPGLRDEEGILPAAFCTVPGPALAVRSVLPASRCPQTPGSSSAAVRASSSLPSFRCFLLPGIPVLSSGAEAPKAFRGAGPGNCAARTARLRRPAWARTWVAWPVRPAEGGEGGRRKPADSLAWPLRGEGLFLPLGADGIPA